MYMSNQTMNDLSHTNCWRLYNYWINCCNKILYKNYEDKQLLTEYDICRKRKKEAMQRADHYTLETADIVGMTTGAA